MVDYLNKLFGLRGKMTVVLGGGYLCGEMARGLARSGTSVVVLDEKVDKAEAVNDEIVEFGGKVFPMAIDVTEG